MPVAAKNLRAIETILTPEARDALRHLDIVARRTVEGFLHGRHRSKRKGVSTDFDHHKLYQPGDPLKHIDWKVSARHDRYYVKRYIEDTALSVQLVVDRSGSMLQTTSPAPSVYLHAARLAASMAYLILKERDSVGLALSSAAGTTWLPCRSTETHLVLILRALATTAPEAKDNIVAALNTVLGRTERKGLVVVISDLMYDPAPVRRRIGQLQARGHEVILCQLRDSTVEEFPFSRWVQFESLEDPSVRRRIDTVPLKRLYLEEHKLFMEEWRVWCRKYDVHLVSTRTDEPAEAVLADYVAYRTEIMGKR